MDTSSIASSGAGSAGGAPRGRGFGRVVAATLVVATIAVSAALWQIPDLKDRVTRALDDLRRGVGLGRSSARAVGDEHGHDHGPGDSATGHAGHDRSSSKKTADDGHEHSEADAVTLSDQARKNIGLRLATVKFDTFTKTVTVPGMVVERRGRSRVLVAAPLTGIITKVHIIEGEAIEAGRKLFDLRLTHEELVQSQAELLQTAEQLDVTQREIDRIERLTSDGALAGKQLLERQYDYQKLQAVLRSKSQSLLLHGLTSAQVEAILAKRELLRELTVVAPAPDDDEAASPEGLSSEAASSEGGRANLATLLQVQSLDVSQGEHVDAGDTLAVLANHHQLYIQGEAFERDLPAVSRAIAEGETVSAEFQSAGGPPVRVDRLPILYVANQVNAELRTVDFYVRLSNELERDVGGGRESRRFIAWRYRPGQRVELRIPVERLEKRIVLPIDALAEDGVETYVFTASSDHFDRRTVHVEYRDARTVVIANDGVIRPGMRVALAGAQLLQLALKNKSGGAVDPHAGHTH